MDLFQSLLDADKALVNWIVGTAAQTDDDRQKMRQALAAKGDLDEAINTLVAYRMKLATSQFDDDATKLAAIAAGLAAVDQNIAKVATVLGYANDVVALATSVIQKVAS